MSEIFVTGLILGFLGFGYLLATARYNDRLDAASDAPNPSIPKDQPPCL